MNNIEMAVFKYDENDINILANALGEAFKQVSRDMRCFDWLSYNPDFYRNQKDKKNYKK
jgi:hypothetical protein